MKTRIILGCLFLLIYHNPAWSLVATVNRTTLEKGETLELSLTVDPRNKSGRPELQALSKEFDILSTGRTQQLSVINGQQSSFIRWSINLSPKHKGKLIIPAINIGTERSQPISIEVLSSQAKHSSNQGETIFIETHASPKTPYVQSELHYVSKLFYASEITTGSLITPKADNAVIKRLGDDLHYETQHQGRRYQVIERHYAIFPQTSGTLTITAPTFSGEVALPTDPTAAWGALLHETIPVKIHGKNLTVSVKAKPPLFKENTWLPAKQVSLTARWLSNPKQWHTGEAATIVLTLQAKGLTAAQLPEISFEGTTEMNTYPDHAELIDRVEDHSNIGLRRQSIAIVPTQAGTLTLPKIDVVWWNTKTAKKMHTTLAKQSFTILEIPKKTSAAITPPVEKTPLSNIPDTHSSYSKPWIFFSVFVLLGWLLTVLVWQRDRLRDLTVFSKNLNVKKPSSFTHAIKQACYNNDPNAVRNALVIWAQHVYHDKPINTLSDLVKLTTRKKEQTFLHALNKACYTASTSWDGKEFWQTMQTFLKTKNKTQVAHSGKKDPLHPLHPDH